MTETQRILMERDGISASEAKEMMREAREALMNGDYEAMSDYLGLEDDYVFDLL